MKLMKKTFSIKRMHCNSCAQLIENELKDKVKDISVSFADERAEITFEKEKISEDEITKTIRKLGYGVYEYNKNEPKIEENNRNNKDRLGLIALIISIIVFFIVTYFYLGIRIPEFNFSQILEFKGKTSLLLLFVTGILTGFHCISMCGGFVVSYTAKNAIEGHKGIKQHLVYGGGKLISYTIIGGIFGLIGGIFAFSAGLRGWVAIIAGMFMIFYSLSMFGIKFFRKFQFNPKFLTNFASKTSTKTRGFYKRPALTGLLNGLFIACGPLQAMYLFAAGSGSFITGATSLFAFGLGTLPVIIGFGTVTSVISHKATSKIFKISAVIVLILGLIMINRGLALTGSAFNFDSIKTRISGSGENSILKDGVQEINMDVDSSGYNPNSFVIKKGVPVKWNINIKQLTGCNNEIILNAYGIDVKLHTGLNVITFTPDKTGTISFSCGMGMLRGSFIVTNSGTASQEEIKSATPPAGSSCGCGG